MRARNARTRVSLGRGPGLALLAGLLSACGGEAAARPSNLLLVILDDVGVEQVGCYPGHVDGVRTPTLDALAARGVRFERAWANPWCSPTRATLLTGRFAFRTGIGGLVKPTETEPGLLQSETCLPEALPTGRFRSAFVGKWHLANPSEGLDNPREQGFEHFRGSYDNLGAYDDPECWTAWDKIEDGVPSRSRGYATTVTVDDALELIEGFADEPWVVVVGFHAGHMPFHAPPPELHGHALSGWPNDRPREHFQASIEALDRELGRLLGALPEDVRARTNVIAIGDNGSPRPAQPPSVPEAHGKGTLFEPALRVPLIVAGPDVPHHGAACAALVSSVDVYSTSIELLTGQPPVAAAGRPVDGLSLVPYLVDPGRVPLRTWALAERFRPNHSQEPRADVIAVREDRFKLIRNVGRGNDRLFDLAGDPGESRDLLADGALEDSAREAYTRLKEIVEGYAGRPAQ